MLDEFYNRLKNVIYFIVLHDYIAHFVVIKMQIKCFKIHKKYQVFLFLYIIKFK